MKHKQTKSNPQAQSIFDDVDRFLAEGNADAALTALHSVQAEVKELFTIPLAIKWAEIDLMKGNLDQVMKVCANACELAQMSPQKGPLIKLQAEALRRMGKEKEGEKLLEDGSQCLLQQAMKLGAAGDFDLAKQILLAGMDLHPAMDLFASANPDCQRILHRTDLN